MTIRHHTVRRTALAVAVPSVLIVIVAGHIHRAPAAAALQSDRAGWTIPEGASRIANPLTATADRLDAGRELYVESCRRCHGPGGRGDGVDADPDHPPGDLTDPRRAARNRDGVVFYKIWNGRSSPDMPALGDEGMSEEDVWTIVAYVQTLRKGNEESARE